MTDLNAQRVAEFRGGFQGEVILPGDSSYDDARKIWNGMIDKRPAMIARCATTADVVRSVKFARDNNLVLAVRGGGHNIAGSALCDDGIVIDLSLMKSAEVDAKARRVTMGAGATLADLDAATQAHGLATTGGASMPVWPMAVRGSPHGWRESTTYSRPSVGRGRRPGATVTSKRKAFAATTV